VYTSQSQALAVLEILVHFESSDILEHYVMIEVRFDPALVTRLELSELPAEWLHEPPPAGLQMVGDEWVAGSASAVLQVPSAIVPDEHNFLLNPAHSDFSRITIGQPLPFPFDSRLFASR
jgi:RES domain-containing protein